VLGLVARGNDDDAQQRHGAPRATDSRPRS
jgi:hypothetical protein